MNHQTYPPKHILSENRTISSKHSTNIRTITRPRRAKFFITQLNCQGLLGKFAFLKELIMEVWKSDIICLSETWLQPTCTKSSSLSIPNYFFFRRDRGSRTHGGLIIYARTGTTISRRTDLEHEDIECITLELTTSTTHHLIFFCYRPSNCKPDHFFSSLSTVLSRAETLNQAWSLTLLGNFNAKHQTWNPQ